MPGGKVARFLKPGKEASRPKKPNLHDMTPWVGLPDGENEFNRWSFEMIWNHLVKIYIINPDLFQKTLALLYRVCVFTDHVEEEGEVRYNPRDAVAAHIGRMNAEIKRGFEDKMNQPAGPGLLEYLHFVDLLGWNEDVKYHVRDGAADFSGNVSTGRHNTIITIISLPLTLSEFIADILKNAGKAEKIDWGIILAVAQNLSKSRGIYVVRKRDLLKIRYLKE